MQQNKSKIKSLQLKLASSEKILNWSCGEVTKSETINYKTFKPEPGGLFCEAIFGPVKDYECACGKYKRVKYRGKVCEKCGVEITRSRVRRNRMGHIKLACPVVHIWMAKELPSPSKISLVLDISFKELEEIIYYVNYVVTIAPNGCGFSVGEVIDLSNSSKENRLYCSKLRKIMETIIKKSQKGSMDFKRATIYYDFLKNPDMPFSIREVLSFITHHSGIKFATGAEAIKELLINVNLKKEQEKLTKEMTKFDPSLPSFKKALKRFEVINWFIESKIKPEWMVLDVIPVTPPDTRPIVQLEGGKFTTSDVNNFYRKIIIRNERLKNLIEQNAPDVILNNEKRMLQDAIDSLFDNSSRGKIASKNKRPLKSLTEHLKGKQGLFRQNLLGKRVDYSARSVIVNGPKLKMYQVGIPAEIILTLYKPFIVHELIKKYDEFGNEIMPLASSIKIAEKMILSQTREVWTIIEKLIKSRPVVLNRAPTLHRLSTQAFEPKIIDGKAIQLHPLTCTAFNADFDGDTMSVFLPISKEAIAEARSILLASWHIISPKDGKPIVTPTQDIVLGIYYVTIEKKKQKGEGIIFSSKEELYAAVENGVVTYHSIIGISTNAITKAKMPQDKILITTPGKVIFNDAITDAIPFINNTNIDIFDVDKTNIVDAKEAREKIEKHEILPAFTKTTLQKITYYLYENLPIEEVSKNLDSIKNVGFSFVTKSGVTVSIFDLPDYSNKYAYFKDADEQVAKIQNHLRKGLLTDDEKYQRTIDVWTKVSNKIIDDFKKIIDDPKNAENSIITIAKSGSRGNVTQISQWLGMRGLMNKTFNYGQKTDSLIIRDTMEIPIKSSLIEGVNVLEYFNACYGTRKSMSDVAMKTSKSGYLTRKLVDSAQDVIVYKNDCGTTKGKMISAITNTDGVVIEKLSERIANRYASMEIVDPKTKKTLVNSGEIITESLAKKIEDLGIKEVEVRSTIHCLCENGVCQKCFGNDLVTKKIIDIGTPIGVVAAQSIGEPATQLNMKSKTTGGARGVGNIAQGFERLKQLLDVITPKEYETAIISTIYGTVTSIKISDEKIIEVKNDNNPKEIIAYKAPINLSLKVTVGSKVVPGDFISYGSANIQELLQISGIEKTREYILQEAQQIYRLQGIEVSDKYLEIIIRQMTNKMKVLDIGDSKLFVGQIIDIVQLIEENKKLLIANKKPINAISLVFGLDYIPSKTSSFLSAASFQDTKKILTDVAINGRKDYLLSLKENVMLGNLIPAGTGFNKTTDEIIKEGEEMFKKEY